MNSFQLLATPLWVNVFIIIPFAAYFYWRMNGGLSITKSILIFVAVFGIAFGFNEAVIVVYLRDVIGMPTGLFEQSQALSQLPITLLTIEFWREAATLVMLLCVAALSARSFRERTAIFLWAFAFWDIFYYVGLWVTVRWPTSLLSPDVLFLIPVPWFAQVWFPIVVSTLSIIAVALTKRK